MATKKQSDQIIVVEKSAKTSVSAAAAKISKPVKATVAAKAVKSPATTKTPAATTSKVTFVLPKEAVEHAETVAVFGDFNNWQNGAILTKQKDGSFKAAVELEKGRSYEYRFLINNEKWENDWAAEAYAPTPFGAYNSVVTG
jgi:1,4-alpha-glucan branching enzyme